MSQISEKEKIITYNVLGFKDGSNKQVLQYSDLKSLSFDRYDLLGIVLKYKFFWQSLPFVTNIAICNSLSLGMSDSKSDIDLFVVTEEGYVYLVRLVMFLGLQILGVRRYGDLIENRFCLSFFVDETVLIDDVMLEEDYYMELWKENLWWLFVKSGKGIEYNFVSKQQKFIQNLFCLKKNKVSLFFEFLFKNKFGVWVSSVLGIFQRSFAHKKYKQKNFPKGVMFEESIIKCHDEDIRWEIRSKVKDLLI